MKRRTIWVEAWQLQCCGEPFAVGDVVTWSVVGADRTRLDTVLGSAVAASVDYIEEHHDGGFDRKVTGEVHSIRLVFMALEKIAGSKTLTTVPGRYELCSVDSATGDENAPPSMSFEALLVELETELQS